MGKRAVDIVNAYVVSFFDLYLKSQDVSFLDGDSPDFPEVDIKTRNT